ncbi:MAG: Tfp pilus assembly protein FimT/FimU [Halioglobus sp.]
MKQAIPRPPLRNLAGFTMLELIAAISIAALVLAVSVPATGRMYQSVLYREAVGDIVTMLQSARYAAINSGRAQDVEVNPKKNQLRFNDKRQQLPKGFKIQVHSAAQLNKRDSGIIRFYPEGGSSGGGIDLTSPTGAGVKILVDWMVGRVTQERNATH